MRGEFELPDGGLVTVDLAVAAGVLREVQVDAPVAVRRTADLTGIGAALDGLPVAATTDDLRSRLDGRLPSAATSTLAKALAIAVRRAVASATNWRDNPWVLVREPPHDAALHMAIDEVLTEEVAAGRRPPTLRIWEWAEPAVVLGSFQSVRNEVDLAAAQRRGVTVVRRVSGGGAMFVRPADTITYSLYVPTSLVLGLSFVESYAFLDNWALGALHDLGVRACYRPINDIASSQGKIAGAAQKRLHAGAVLHHTTMAYDIDPEALLDVLRLGRRPLSGRGTKSAQKRVDPLRRQITHSRVAVIDKMVETFAKRYGVTVGSLTERELVEAKRRVEAKFATPEWTARIP